MKGIQIVAPRTAKIVDVPIPDIADNEVLVKVKACVTCAHWDMTIYRGVDIFERPGYPKYPIPVGYPGHEMSGEVVKIGSAVTKFAVGDRVASVVTGGEHAMGFYVEYINRPEDTIAKVPDCVSDDAAASLEMARYVASHLSVLDVRGLRTAVVGLGAAGLIAMQELKAMGAAEVLAIDVLDERLALARELGASGTINSRKPEELQQIKDRPLQASVDATGAAPGLQVALDHTRGPVVMYGVVHGDAVISTRHWYSGTYIPKRKQPDAQDTAFVQAIWCRGQLDTEKFLGARLPFEEYGKGIEMLMDKQAVRVLYYPG
ncbi:MAG: zinc-binding dehydrogenase [Anaerolineales bacterium]|nr:zinc-binding dehydrogenase [Anaerolineales bacterium]